MFRIASTISLVASKVMLSVRQALFMAKKIVGLLTLTISFSTWTEMPSGFEALLFRSDWTALLLGLREC